MSKWAKSVPRVKWTSKTPKWTILKCTYLKNSKLNLKGATKFMVRVEMNPSTKGP